MQNAIDKFKAEVRKELGVQSNADRIRAMSDEELAEFISKVNRTCMVDALGGDTQCDYEDVNCTECKAKFCGIQKWLQSEVEV